MSDNEKPAPGVLEIALGARQLELELFWRRALFFWGFIASAFIGFANTYPERPMVAMAVSCFGVICSLCWALVNRGSKYWYEAWEVKVKRYGGEDVQKLFSHPEASQKKGLWSAKRYSVSRVAIALSDFTFVLWVGILLCQAVPFFIKDIEKCSPSKFVVGALLLVTVIYAVLILARGHGRQSASATEEAGG